MVTTATWLQDTKYSSARLHNPTITLSLVVPNGYMTPHGYRRSTVTQCRDTPSAVKGYGYDSWFKLHLFHSLGHLRG